MPVSSRAAARGRAVSLRLHVSRHEKYRAASQGMSTTLAFYKINDKHSQTDAFRRTLSPSQREKHEWISVHGSHLKGKNRQHPAHSNMVEGQTFRPVPRTKLRHQLASICVAIERKRLGHTFASPNADNKRRKYLALACECSLSQK
jgi:hypothetical protein